MPARDPGHTADRVVLRHLGRFGVSAGELLAGYTGAPAY
jgi:hypothetical protein